MDNVLKIFIELKGKKLIDKEIKLKSSKNVLNFKKSFFGNTILYNPSFISLDENKIRFILLHEQGHKERFQWTYYVILFSTLVFYIYWFSMINSPLNWIKYGILFTLSTLSFIILRPLIWLDEYHADLSSTQKLKEYYKLNKPELLLEDSLNSILSIKSKVTVMGKIIRVISKIGKFHPSIQKRIEYVKKNLT